MGNCLTKKYRCVWCEKLLIENYYCYNLHNNTLFRFCSEECIKEDLLDEGGEIKEIKLLHRQ